jgi:hypothetical protein
VIEIQPCLVNGSCALRHDPWPGKRKPEYIKTHLFRQQYIFLVTVIEIAGMAGICFVPDLTLAGGESIPDRDPFPIGIMCAFILESGDHYTPFEIIPEIITTKGHPDSIMIINIALLP